MSFPVDADGGCDPLPGDVLSVYDDLLRYKALFSCVGLAPLCLSTLANVLTYRGSLDMAYCILPFLFDPDDPKRPLAYDVSERLFYIRSSSGWVRARRCRALRSIISTTFKSVLARVVSFYSWGATYQALCSVYEALDNRHVTGGILLCLRQLPYMLRRLGKQTWLSQSLSDVSSGVLSPSPFSSVAFAFECLSVLRVKASNTLYHCVMYMYMYARRPSSFSITSQRCVSFC